MESEIWDNEWFDSTEEFEEPEDYWDDEESDEPPPRPTIRRRPWGPQPPEPLSTAASIDTFEPPIP